MKHEACGQEFANRSELASHLFHGNCPAKAGTITDAEGEDMVMVNIPLATGDVYAPSVFGVEDIAPQGEFGPGCICVGYEGQGWGCPMHGAVVECQKCHTIHTEIQAAKEYGMITYRCSICGDHYRRNAVTGAYL